MTTISLCMIVKDEEQNLDQCLRSVEKYVDQIIIADTGSTDRTREIAVSHGASVYQFDHRNHPEAFFVDDENTCKAFAAPQPFSGDVALGDFAAARNESFKHAVGDYVLWLDADDVLEGAENLRQAAADIHARGLDFGFLAYDYARDHLGRVFYRQWRERIVRKSAARWVNPVHEVLLPSGPIQPVRLDGITVSHRRKADRKSIPNRNYKILLRQLWQLTGSGDPEVACRDARNDPRTLFYLGQEARFVEPKRAAVFYEEYLKRSGWPEERSAAHSAIGQLLEFGMLARDPVEAYAMADLRYAAAAAEMPENPDGVFGLARIAYLRGRWLDCVNYSNRGFAIGNTDSMLGANPMDRLYRPHVYYNHALAKLGRLDEAIASCKTALAVCPDDPPVPGGASGMMAFNLRVYEEELQRRKVAAPTSGRRPLEFDKNEAVDAPPEAHIPPDALLIWALQIWKQNIAANDVGKARAALEAIPKSVELDPVVARMRAYTERKFGKGVTVDEALGIAKKAVDLNSETLKAWAGHQTSIPFEVARLGATSCSVRQAYELDKSKSIVFWIGPSIEPWDPTTPNTTGVGGSETACIEMAKNLRKLGHSVTVYGCCPQSEGIYDGVKYVHWQNCTGIDCDVFISSRAPQILENPQHVRAKLRLLWVHDIHVGPPTPQLERWLLRFDRFLCLSEWHKAYFLSCYPTLHPSRVIVTRNGIDPERFVACPDCDSFDSCENECLGRGRIWGKSNHLIFSSSPNRGLDTLLANFPHIRAQVPDAELHVYYGFDVWEKFAIPRNDPAELAEITRHKKSLEDAVKNGGVFWHGRVNQRELAEAFMRSKVWGYPTSFSETSCITAMEAQAAGCVPVCTPLAALTETVKHGVFIKTGETFGDQFVAECVRLLKDDSYREGHARPGREWALANLSWAGLAREWVEMFSRLSAELEANPVPMWRSA